MARPTKWTKKLQNKAWDYVKGEWESKEVGHAVPSVVGLCKYLDRGKSTIYDWAKDEKKEFSDILEAIKENQELIVFNKSLKGEYNATIAKLLLGKHGYHDKQDTMQTNVDMSHEEWLSTLDDE